MIIQKITLSELIEDPFFPDLVATYESECAMADMPPCRPQMELYHKFEQAGFLDVLGVYSARDLVGFACLLTTVIPHYGVPAASTESIYVNPAHRPTGGGIRLIRACRQLAKERGATALFISTPVGSTAEKTLRRMKSFKPVNTVFITKL